MDAIIYIIILIAVAGAAKFARSKELSGKLGREVEDHELVSLNAWLEAERLTDARKGINPAKKSPVLRSERKTAPAAEDNLKQITTEKKAVAPVPKESFEPPDNCPKCGAALSKGISQCRFCGTHSSRRALEEHAAIFLHDLEKDFEEVVPAVHGALRLGCFLIPLLAVTATVTAYFLLPPDDFGYSQAFGIPVLSMIVAYIWLNAVDAILTRREGLIFEREIKPKILEFSSANRLQSLELVGIAKRHFDKDSKFMAHIHRRF